jgi:ATP-dependent DNA helicase 2 subunit 2
MPFADDVRKYTFASLDNLVSKKGEVITEHPYIPTEEQLEAMDNFVDAMDLMEAGEKDEEGYVISLSPFCTCSTSIIQQSRPVV